MPAHFARYLNEAQSPGVILLREAVPIATAIEELVLIWSASEPKNGLTDWCGFRFEKARPRPVPVPRFMFEICSGKIALE